MSILNERIKCLPPLAKGHPPKLPEGRRILAAAPWRGSAFKDLPARREAAAGLAGGRSRSGSPSDQNAISVNVLPSTNAASLLFQTLTRKDPGSSDVAAATLLLPALDAMATSASLSVSVTVYCPTASL